MPDIVYPTLRVTVLQGLRDLKEMFENDPAVLKDGNCPYDPDTIAILTRILTPKIVRVEVPVETAAPAVKQVGLLNGEDSETVEITIMSMLKELRELGEGEKTLDTQTKVAIIKAKATLIDQVMKQHERIMNIKRIANFQAVVFSVLDDFVSEADRQAYIKRMEPYNAEG